MSEASCICGSAHGHYADCPVLLKSEITRLRAEVEDLGDRLHHVHRLWANNEHALRAKVERLEADLATARADALDEAAQVAKNATFPEPQSMVEQAIVAGGKKTAANIAAAIRALKSGTGDTP